MKKDKSNEPEFSIEHQLKAKEAERIEIQKQVRAYLDDGGSIERVDQDEYLANIIEGLRNTKTWKI